MGSRENIKLVRDLMEAARKPDVRKYGEFFADDAAIRVAGVPHALGGTTRGREQIVANFAQQSAPPGQAEIRSVFADDSHACAIVKVNGNFGGTQFFRGTGKPFSTYECIVYDIENGRIKGQTVYMNFLDVYVQAGLIPIDLLLSESMETSGAAAAEVRGAATA